MKRGLILFSSCALLFILLLWPWRMNSDFRELKSTYNTSNGVQTFLDRQGEVLHVEGRAAKDRRQHWVTLDSIPSSLNESLLAIEDKRFYEHHGVDFLALLAAIRDRSQLGKIRGASTISMQLAGLLQSQESRSRNILRKIQQVFGALYLESKWSKAEILEAYWNRVTFRQDLVGIEAAAQGLFQKAPHALTREESYLLSSLLSSPNSSPARVSAKACLFLRDVSCENIQALAETHFKTRARLPSRASNAPHFVRLLKSPDRIVQTTLDKNLQIKTQEFIKAQMQALSSQNVHDAAALVVNYKTGEIIAYVGSSGEFATAKEVDGVKALRQAGSTLKPLLFARAMDDDLITADTWLDDSPFQVQTPGGLYSPQNYDDTFKGIIPAKVALASSLNIPAVRVIDLVTVDTFYQTLDTLGFTLAPRQNYGHSLALGAADVSLMQLVNAYGVLARGGLSFTASLTPIDPPPAKTIFKQATARTIQDILSSKENRALTFGFDNPLATPYPAAVKTGTSKDMRDNWCIGWDDRFVVGVWVGNFNGTPMWNVSGISGAAPIWRALLDELQDPRKLFQTTELKSPAPEESSAPKPNLGGSIAEITYPLDGTLIAFDPDIPEENQAVILEHSSKRNLDWVLDKRRLASPIIPLSELRPGSHRLELVDDKRRIVSKVSFEVRGKSSAIANSE